MAAPQHPDSTSQERQPTSEPFGTVQLCGSTFKLDEATTQHRDAYLYILRMERRTATAKSRDGYDLSAQGAHYPTDPTPETGELSDTQQVSDSDDDTIVVQDDSGSDPSMDRSNWVSRGFKVESDVISIDVDLVERLAQQPPHRVFELFLDHYIKCYKTAPALSTSTSWGDDTKTLISGIPFTTRSDDATKQTVTVHRCTAEPGPGLRFTVETRTRHEGRRDTWNGRLLHRLGRKVAGRTDWKEGGKLHLWPEQVTENSAVCYTFGRTTTDDLREYFQRNRTDLEEEGWTIPHHPSS